MMLLTTLLFVGITKGRLSLRLALVTMVDCSGCWLRMVTSNLVVVWLPVLQGISIPCSRITLSTTVSSRPWTTFEGPPLLAQKWRLGNNRLVGVGSQVGFNRTLIWMVVMIMMMMMMILMTARTGWARCLSMRITMMTILMTLEPSKEPSLCLLTLSGQQWTFY